MDRLQTLVKMLTTMTERAVNDSTQDDDDDDDDDDDEL